MVRPRKRAWHRTCASLVLLLLCSGAAAQAQFTVAAVPRSALSPEGLADIEARAVKGVRRLLPTFVGFAPQPIRIFVHRQPGTMPKRIRDQLPPRWQGLALRGRSEIHLLLAAIHFTPPNDLNTVLHHELVHVLLDQYVGAKAGPFIPSWLHEGLAQALTESSFDGVTEADIVFRVSNGTHLRFYELVEGFPKHSEEAIRLAYAQSKSFVAFLMREIGVEQLLAAARDSGPERTFDVALAKLTNESLSTYQKQWEEYVVYHSGASWRFLNNHCFLFLIVLAVPLLAMAVARRLNRDQVIAEHLDRLDQQERMEQEQRMTDATDHADESRP